MINLVKLNLKIKKEEEKFNIDSKEEKNGVCKKKYSIKYFTEYDRVFSNAYCNFFFFTALRKT